MAQPKKLTPAQRKQKKDQEQYKAYQEELSKLLSAAKNKPADQASTWRWAALEIFRELQAFPKSSERDVMIERALYVARQAQVVMNFAG